VELEKLEREDLKKILGCLLVNLIKFLFISVRMFVMCYLLLFVICN